MNARVLMSVGSLLLAGALVVSAGERRNGPRAQPAAGPKNNRSPLRDFEKLPPEQRRRALDKLPEHRRERVQEKLNQIQKLPPEQRQRLEQYAERLQQLPPERQQRVRTAIQDLRQFPPDRQQVVRQEFQRIGGMSAAERESYFQGEEFKTRYSPEERRTLVNLSELNAQR